MEKLNIGDRVKHRKHNTIGVVISLTKVSAYILWDGMELNKLNQKGLRYKLSTLEKISS